MAASRAGRDLPQRASAGAGVKRARQWWCDVRADFCRLLPTFRGLGAVRRDANAQAAIVGLSRGSGAAPTARAALASIAFQSAAQLQALCKDRPVQELRIDGGASVNDPSMQFQADLLGIPVLRLRVAETLALGAACLA